MGCGGFDHIISIQRRRVTRLNSRQARPVATSPVREGKAVGRTYRFVSGMALASSARALLISTGKWNRFWEVNLVRPDPGFLFHLLPDRRRLREKRGEDSGAAARSLGDGVFALSQLPRKALRDAAFFTEALASESFSIGTFCVNRAWLHPFPDVLPGGLAGEVLAWYKAVSDSHRACVWQLRETYGSLVRGHSGIFPNWERDVDGLAALSKVAIQMHLEAIRYIVGFDT